jgi:RNA polymerase sigma factor (sigma-70 family)
MPDKRIEDLLRQLAPRVLGALVRRYGDFGAAEDAVQEAMLDASVQWPRDGWPDNPHGWLVRVAHRRMTDHLRAEIARRRREETEGTRVPRDKFVAPAADAPRGPAGDDTLTLLFLCCHPDLTPGAQIPLTLRAVGGLTTPEIARAFLVPEATMAKRITRAKQRIGPAGFRMPTPAERDERVRAVLHVLYLIFNEGYSSTSGPDLQRVELTAEAIRLARELHRLLPDDHEVTGLLALLLLTDARRPARTGPAGELVPMAEQDRSRWDSALIGEGVELVSASLAATPRFGPYLLQAAIAAVHDEALSDEATDWPQILALYGLLAGVTDNPAVALNRVVAVLKVHGPAAALAALDQVTGADPYRVTAVRAHLLDEAGDRVAARRLYLEAARVTTSLPERRYLLARATPP